MFDGKKGMAEGRRKNGISGNFELRGRLFLLFDEVRVSFLGGRGVAGFGKDKGIFWFWILRGDVFS